MSNRRWIGAALGLALCSVPLASCSRGAEQSQSGAQQPGALQWSRSAEEQLLQAIANAPANGLRPDLFLKGDLPKDGAERAKVLTDAGLRYADALARGFTDPEALFKDYTIPRPKNDVRQGLARAIQEGKVGEWLASLAPQTDEYRALAQAHLMFLKLAIQSKAAPVPAGKPIRPGQRDPRMPQIAAALAANSYIPPAGTQPPQRYAGALVAAVRQLQSDYGMKPDGTIGDDVIAALNGGAGLHARQTAVALERLRWLERAPPPNRIDVNTAATFLDYWIGGTPRDRRRVVVGEPPEWMTPQLQAPMRNLVANPKWRLPDRIVADELADKGPGWFADNKITKENGKYVQQSGPKNSLGLVKFDMDDEQQIYLHDTPAKPLFAEPERHRSHGCIRVEGALDFAGMIAAQQGVLDKFEEGLAGGEEKWVKLPTPIQVRLLYHTAFLDGGVVRFVPDVYGWDGQIARALGLEGGTPRPAFKRRPGDVGP